MEILQNNNRNIEKLIHLADIHISRNPKRHHEYEQVFARTINSIKSQKIKDALIVISGDLIHERSTLRPEQLTLTKKFVMSLCDLFPLILIKGNHDEDAHLKEINSIEPIINDLATKNPIYFLDDDKVYMYNNILFGLTTMHARSVTKCKEQTGKVRVGVYHGTLQGAKNDLDFVFTNTKQFTVKNFSDTYELSLLGDIHRFQYLNKEKTVAYAGSLIQQDIGEHPDNHGYILWNVKDLSSKFIKIQNDYKQMKVFIDENENISYDRSIEITPHIKFNIYYSNITEEKADEYGKKLLNSYPGGSYSKLPLKSVNTSIVNLGIKNQQNIMNITNKEIVKNIIFDYVEENNIYKNLSKDIKKVYKEKIIKKISNYVEKSKYDYDNIELKMFKLVRLEFDNFILYGKGNHIIYEKLNGIIGIVGNNHTGKTTTITALIYSIFGDNENGGSVKDTINLNEKKMRTNVIFYINDIKYQVIRERTKRNKNIKNDSTDDSNENVIIYKNDKMISKSKPKKANELIKSIVGSKDNFIDIFIMKQQNCSNFANLSPDMRKVLVCKLFKLDILCEIAKLVHSDELKTIKEKAIEEKYCSNEDYTSVLDKLDGKIKKSNDILKEKKERLNKTTEKMIKYTYKLNNIDYNDDIDKKLENYDDIIKNTKRDIDDINEKKTYMINNIKFEEEKWRNTDISLLKKDIDELTKECESNYENIIPIKLPNRSTKEYDDNIKSLSENIEKLSQKEEELKNKISNIKIKDIDKNLKKEYEKRTINKEKNNNLLEQLNNKLVEATDKLTKMKDYKYDEKCKFCIDNSLTKDKLKYEEEVTKNEKEIKTITKKINDDNNFIEENTDVYNEIIENDENKAVLRELRDELKNTELSIKLEKSKLENNNDKLNEINKDIENKKNNARYNEKIKNLKEQINTKKRIIQEKMDSDVLITKNRSDILECDNKILKLTHAQKEAKTAIKDLKKMTANKDEYNRVKEKVLKVEQQKIKDENEITKVECELNNLRDETSKLKNKKEINDEKNNEINRLQKELTCLNIIYNSLYSEDGAINSILRKKILPHIQQRINLILKEIDEYTVSINVKSNGIEVIKHTTDGILPIKGISGGENFNINFASRIAFRELTNVVKANFMILDEATHNLDNETVDKLPAVMDYMKSIIQFIVMVSHDERVTKLFDKEYVIVKNKGKSKIKID